LATFGLLIVVFGINLGLNLIKAEIEDSARDEDGNTDNLNLVRFITVLTALLTITVNFLLGRIIRKFSTYENHMTYSAYHVSVAFKLSFSMFINVGIVPLFVNLSKEDWFTSSGLVVDILYNTLSI
jgi:hypothetical protein